MSKDSKKPKDKFRDPEDIYYQAVIDNIKRILKAAGKKQFVTRTDTSIRISVNLSSEIKY